jgi:microcystin-dependent protein
MTSYCRTPLTFSAHQKATVGDTKFSAVTSDHMGWMKCDGRLVNITDFQFLFNVIGYSFGGSGTQFRLPNPAGRVPGAVGTGTDINNSTFTALMGLSTGEYVHRLTIAEMPSHNHGVNGTDQSSYNNSTSIEYTNISTTEVSTTKITDGGHRHGYTTYLDTNRGYVAAGEDDGILANTQSLSTATSFANIQDPGHKHPIIDKQHAHTLHHAGDDVPHNNVQPTLFMGNMFIFNGIVNYPSFTTGYPYTPGKNIW